MPSATNAHLLNIDIAIIGGGISGLSAAVALSALSHVSVRLFERGPELREYGAGISVAENSWKVLELLGAAGSVKGAPTVPGAKRNGYTGEIVLPEPGIPRKRGPTRVRRARLQAALAAQVPQGVIKFNKKLVSLQDLEGGGVTLEFADGTNTTADLVVGGDRVARQYLFPEYALRYTGMLPDTHSRGNRSWTDVRTVGNTAWRVLLPAASLAHIPDFPLQTSWWFGVGGHIFMSPVDEPSDPDAMFEFSCRSGREPEVSGQTVSWGIEAKNAKVLSRFKDYDLRIVEALAQVPEGDWKEFALFSGPCIEHITGWDKVVLIGDASHPLAGAFGSGAAFAMEDGWIIARALEHSLASGSSTPVASALCRFESIRSPYYQRMYQFRDSQKPHLQKMQQETREDFDNLLRARMNKTGLAGKRPEGWMDWIYKNNIEKVWEEYLHVEKKRATSK
ncbi:FAD/NAD(P)-binding domain-containing protein [Hyaloscypha variabilis F]|uniref:FAD/NAD(P)-binding domain-containing protein n=1 Tax=Hyaloscypha variabilis (strain UAMH 11265 / GT02V1 / F) TaxID=1149755 RepID=A0A2J6RG86_HYAVF|nr:FAD/NAD(P)-binding domain-containing protein [Hyaloscypha variabilis F]